MHRIKKHSSTSLSSVRLWVIIFVAIEGWPLIGMEEGRMVSMLDRLREVLGNVNR